MSFFRLSLLADVDAAVEIGELHFRAAAANSPVDGLVNLDNVFAAILPAILDGLLWRGSLNLDAQVTGSLNDMHITAGGDLKDFRRYDIERAGMLRLISRCQGEYSKGLMGFSCNMPVESGLARFSGQLSPGTSLNYDLNVVANRIPLSALATFARQAKRTLPDDLNAGGEVDAAFAFHSHDNVPRDWHGTGMTSNFLLESALASKPIPVTAIRFHLGAMGMENKPVVLPAIVARRVHVLPKKPEHVPPPGSIIVDPFSIQLGTPAAVQANALLSSQGYSLALKGVAPLDRLLGMTVGDYPSFARTSRTPGWPRRPSAAWDAPRAEARARLR